MWYSLFNLKVQYVDSIIKNCYNIEDILKQVQYYSNHRTVIWWSQGLFFKTSEHNDNLYTKWLNTKELKRYLSILCSTCTHISWHTFLYYRDIPKRSGQSLDQVSKNKRGLFQFLFVLILTRQRDYSTFYLHNVHLHSI